MEAGEFRGRRVCGAKRASATAARGPTKVAKARGRSGTPGGRRGAGPQTPPRPPPPRPLSPGSWVAGGPGLTFHRRALSNHRLALMPVRDERSVRTRRGGAGAGGILQAAVRLCRGPWAGRERAGRCAVSAGAGGRGRGGGAARRRLLQAQVNGVTWQRGRGDGEREEMAAAAAAPGGTGRPGLWRARRSGVRWFSKARGAPCCRWGGLPGAALCPGRARPRVGAPALGPRSGLARGGETARADGGAAPGPGRRGLRGRRSRPPPPGSAPRPWRPSRVAAPEGLCAFAPAPEGDAGAAAHGGERVLTARPGRTGAGLWQVRVRARRGAGRQRRRGSILGTGGGGPCAGPQWTPSQGPGGKEAAVGRKARALGGPPGEDCSCVLAGDQVWVPGGGWPRPSFRPSLPLRCCVPEHLDSAKEPFSVVFNLWDISVIF